MAILRITDGTTTINFYDDNNYALIKNAWSPKRAKQLINILGYGSPFTNVIETIPIAIHGNTSQQVYEKLETLSDLLAQAERWGNGENVTAVTMLYQPLGSALANPLESVIWGVGGSDMLVEPPTFPEIDSNGFVLSPIIVRFARVGVLVGDSETKTSTGSTGNPAIETTSAFTDDLNILSPYDLTVGLDESATYSPADSEAFLLIQNASNKLLFAEAEDNNTGMDSTDTAIAGSSAGSVARVASNADTNEKLVMAVGAPFNTNTRLMAFWLVLRNRSPSTVAWTVWGKAYDYDVSPTGWDAPIGSKITIPSGDNNIQAIFLGIFSLADEIVQFRVYAQNDVTGTATTDDLDVDYLCGMELDANARYLHFPSIGSANVSADTDIVIENRINSFRNPDVYMTNTVPQIVGGRIPLDGTARLFANGQYVSCLLFGYKNSDTTYFTLVDTNNAEMNYDISATRSRAYLIPQ